MKKFYPLVKQSLCQIFLCSCFLISCDLPVDKENEKQNWYKGNLHTHSYWSDGDDFPERIMDWYKSRDYHFLALSDHNIIAEGEKWINLPKGEIYERAFDQYLDQFGRGAIEHRVEDDTMRVKLRTFEEYAPIYEEQGRFLMLKSEEITDRFEDLHVHLNASNIQKVIKPQGGNSIVDVLQNNIDAVAAQRDSTGEPIMVHINHPNFFYSISVEDMIQLRGERFFEVYNGHHMVNNLGDSAHVSTEEMWDLINIAYLADGKPLIYGLATDDTHNYHVTGREWSNAGRGWVVVEADSLSPEALIESMEAGRFYSSTGVTLSHLSFENSRLRLEVDEKMGVQYEIQVMGYRSGASAMEIISSEQVSTLELEVGPEWEFVRAKVISSKEHENPVAENEMEVAWTQPVRPIG